MFLSNILFCVVVLYFSATVDAKKCADCVPISSCQAALSILVNLEYGERGILQGIKNALCGFNGFEAQVCCSHFSMIKDSIDNHPNVALLPEDCGKIRSTIKGNIDKPYEFPWVTLFCMRLDDGRNKWCTGTIINSRYILTTAICIALAKDIVGIRIEKFDMSKEYESKGRASEYTCEPNIDDVTAEKVIIHEKFKYTKRSLPQYDIALVRLNNPIDFTQRNAAPICLPVSQIRFDIKVKGKYAIVAGWGSNTGGEDPLTLSKAQVLVNMEGHCRNYNETTRKIICANERNMTTCYGMTGSPLMIEGDDQDDYRYTQYGIGSYGPMRCGTFLPGMYTDVTKFVRWILDNIEE